MKVEKRDYQQECLQILKQTRKQGQNRALVHMATGLGKSYIAMQDILQVNPKKVLFTASMKDILIEAQAEAQRQGLAHKIEFVTLQYLYINIDTIKANEYDYIVYDEAHHMQAKTYLEVFNKLKPKFILALTATPNRHDGKQISKLFGKPIYVKTLGEALVQGWLANIEYQLLFDEAITEALNKGFNRTSIMKLRQLLSVKIRNKQIVSSIEEQKKRLKLTDASTIVFCSNIEHCERVARLMKGYAYHSSLSRVERDRLFNKFSNGTIKTLCVVDSFNEGVNIPDAELLIFLRSTASATIYFQQLGRGLRKTKSKQKITVLDFAANIERLRYVQILMTQIELAEKIFKDDSIETSSMQLEMNKKNIKEVSLLGDNSFIFSSEIIDVLEYLDEIQGDILEGELFLKDLSKKYKIKSSTLRILAEKIGIRLKRRKTFHLVIEAQDWAKLIKKFPYIVQGEIPGMKVLEIAEKYGLSQSTVNSHLKQLGVHKSRMSSTERGMRIGRIISPQVLEDLKSRWPLHYGNPSKSDVELFTMDQLSREFGVSTSVISNFTRELKLVPTKRKNRRGGMLYQYTIEQKNQIKTRLDSRPSHNKKARPVCSVNGCESISWAKGQCRDHYEKQRRKIRIKENV